MGKRSGYSTYSSILKFLKLKGLQIVEWKGMKFALLIALMKAGDRGCSCGCSRSTLCWMRPGPAGIVLILKPQSRFFSRACLSPAVRLQGRSGNTSYTFCLSKFAILFILVWVQADKKQLLQPNTVEFFNFPSPSPFLLNEACGKFHFQNPKSWAFAESFMLQESC